MTSARAARLMAVALVLWAHSAQATIPLVEGETVQSTLGGQVQTLTGYQHIPYDTGPFVDEIGINSTVARLEWGLNLGEHVTLSVHNRLFWQLTSEDLALAGGTLGLGVSAPPGRHVDLSTTLLEGDGFLFEHDVDRLVVRLFFDQVDFSLGRQAITWGNAVLFPVADLWTAFSPFELDTTQKRGVDAARALVPVGDRVELDFVVADKGEVEDLSGGLRTNLFLEAADVYAAAAKIWNEVLLFAGVAADLDTVSLRLDAVLPYHLDDREVQIPRATIGLDYYATDLILSVEVHVNGTGTTDESEYLQRATGETFTRGESYYLGRYLAGAFVSYSATELVSLSLTTIANLVDPSAIFAPSLAYQIAENADLTLGAYIPVGATPTLLPTPALESEFGTYGQLYFVQLAAYY